MIHKLSRTMLRTLAFVLALCATGGAWANFPKDNPVTGESESIYTYKYVGNSGTWTTADWENNAGNNPGKVPQYSDGDGSVWDSLLIDGEKTVTASSIEGWEFNIGLFEGANLTVTTLKKWQGGCSVRVDKDSKLTISGLGSGTYNGANNFYVAASGGITYGCDYGKAGDFYYHFAGVGSVVYKNLTGGNHTIKAADVTLEQPAEKVRRNKTLISFSNQPTFSADAAIAIKNSIGT